MSDDEFPKLNPNEAIIKQDSAKHVRHEGQTKQGGTLVLTNQRLLFGRHTSFLFFLFKKTTVAVDIMLNQIKKVGTKGTLRKSLQVSYSENGEYETAVFQLSDVDEWVAKIESEIGTEEEY